MLKDPVEYTPQYLAIREELEAELQEKLKNFPHGIGFCHVYWGMKKRLLKEKYGIDWKSPAELNPTVMFD